MSEEADNFKLSFKASPEATFLELHQAILAAVGYPDDQMTSFFTCNSDWEKDTEVTLIEMGYNAEYDTHIMEQTALQDLLFEQKQRLMYVFDPMFERCFFGSLSKIEDGYMDGIQLIEKKGEAPQQLKTEDPAAALSAGSNDLGIFDEFAGQDGYNDDDIDMDGYQDLSFDDGSMF